MKKNLPCIADRMESGRFSNGLRYYVIPNHRTNSVNVMSFVETGSVHEGENLGCGLSHFLEHMMFAGTKNYPGCTEIADRINAMGGKVNACTSYTYTMYYCTIPSVRTREGIGMIADMVRNPLFPDDRFKTEKDVILRECAMRDDQADSVLSELSYETMFRKHPVRIPIIGTVQGISRVTRGMMEEYYRARYAACRTFFVLAGDVEFSDAEAILGSELGDWGAGNPSEPYLPIEPAQYGVRFASKEFPDPSARFDAVWKIPVVSVRERAALDVLTGILAGPDSSRLYRSLVTEERLVMDIDANTLWMPWGGVAGITAEGSPENLQKAESRALEILNSLKTELVSEAELERTLAGVELGLYRLLRQNAGMAQMAASAIHNSGSVADVDTYMRSVQEVTPEDVRRAAEKYFEESGMTRTELRPKTVRKPPVKTSPSSEPIKPPVMLTENSSAVKVSFLRDRLYPVAGVSLVFPGGRIFGGERWGIGLLLESCLKAGNGRYSEAAFTEYLDDHALNVSVRSGNNAFTVDLECTESHFDEGMDALEAMLSDPLFGEHALEREKENLLQEIESEYVSDPLMRGMREGLRLFYGPEHVYGYSMYEKRNAFSALTPDDLRLFYRDTVLNRNRAVLSFYGDLTESRARKAADRLIAAIPWNGRDLVVPSAGAGPAEAVRMEVELEMEQAVVLSGRAGLGADSPDQSLLSVLHEAENGLSSKLSKAVREKSGLAYYTGMLEFCGMGTGTMSLYAGTSGKDVDRVLKLFKKEEERLAKKGLDAAEFEAAKAAYLFRLEEVLGQDSFLLNRNLALSLFYGEEPDSMWRNRDRVQALKRAEENAFVKGKFGREGNAVVVVRPGGRKTQKK